MGILKNCFLKRICGKDKIRFDYAIKFLDFQNLGLILNHIRDFSPKAIKGNENEVEILVDNINQYSYDLIRRYYKKFFRKKYQIIFKFKIK